MPVPVRDVYWVLVKLMMETLALWCEAASFSVFSVNLHSSV